MFFLTLIQIIPNCYNLTLILVWYFFYIILYNKSSYTYKPSVVIRFSCHQKTKHHFLGTFFTSTNQFFTPTYVTYINITFFTLTYSTRLDINKAGNKIFFNQIALNVNRSELTIFLLDNRGRGKKFRDPLIIPARGGALASP